MTTTCVPLSDTLLQTLSIQASFSIWLDHNPPARPSNETMSYSSHQLPTGCVRYTVVDAEQVTLPPQETAPSSQTRPQDQPSPTIPPHQGHSQAAAAAEPSTAGSLPSTRSEVWHQPSRVGTDRSSRSDTLGTLFG